MQILELWDNDGKLCILKLKKDQAWSNAAFENTINFSDNINDIILSDIIITVNMN